MIGKGCWQQNEKPQSQKNKTPIGWKITAAGNTMYDKVSETSKLGTRHYKATPIETELLEQKEETKNIVPP